MNEPGSAPDSPTRRVDLHDTTIQSSARYFAHQNLPRWGVTVGLKTVLASTEVWVIANGAGKADIVGRTVHGDISASNPASLLRHHSNCLLFRGRRCRRRPHRSRLATCYWRTDSAA